MMKEAMANNNEQHDRLSRAYQSEKPRFMARLKKAGKTLEEAEDILHELYAETVERLPLLTGVRNLPAWINSLLSKRIVDAWRHQKVRQAAGESDIAEDTLREIIAGTGLNPLDAYVQENILDALNDALRALPEAQRRVIEAQVFGGKSFREIAEASGESIDTISARKRYALQNLSHALREWIQD